MPPLARSAMLVLLLAAGAAAPASSGTVVPVDVRESWTVGISAFRGEGLDPADAWLAWSVPLLLRDQIAGLAIHDVDASGRDALARVAIARERRVLLASIERLRDARDGAVLGGTPPAVSGAAALAEAMERLAWLDGLAPSEVAVADRKPIVFKDGAEPGLLLAAPFGSRGEAAGREDVDLLVGGSVQAAAG